MGDVGYLDDAGRFWYCGRKSQRVETTDGPLFTECVEAVLNTHPAVRRSALVGIGPRGERSAGFDRGTGALNAAVVDTLTTRLAELRFAANASVTRTRSTYLLVHPTISRSTSATMRRSIASNWPSGRPRNSRSWPDARTRDRRRRIPGSLHCRSAAGARRPRARALRAASIRELESLGVEMIRGDLRGPRSGRRGLRRHRLCVSRREPRRRESGVRRRDYYDGECASARTMSSTRAGDEASGGSCSQAVRALMFEGKDQCGVNEDRHRAI